ncbi:MAG: hypothetical protein ISQ06_05255 [Planctomycetaceae bacterium]|jgi:hypothetical protein|nr:hypothetical protein [Planctomycetaceae bacterium]
MPDSSHAGTHKETDVVADWRKTRESAIELPELSLHRAVSLLNQQLWCWGRDIEAAGGNLLVHHGFQRIEKPAGSSSSSVYRLDITTTSRVILRGFGVFFGDDRWGGLFLPRFEFTPQFTVEPDLSRPAWGSEDLPPLAPPREDQIPCCQSLLLALIDWIRRYEVWIAEHKGVSYRNRTLTMWKAKHGWVVAGSEIVSAWRTLGQAVAKQPGQFIHRQEQPSCSWAG